ncbi:unnamed protein product [Polarella glacialis]|uniref:Major facilitator superfamily (MFS) profile domain-containing protein n=1 Tax=Polarella glacialis TaxID=89957 RepID=A0A813FJH6_POLGL|nr:unnamed protein product [Polarella glacialis]CAE8673490.1 unnamed protein product [Polarella glacialis]
MATRSISRTDSFELIVRQTSDVFAAEVDCGIEEKCDCLPNNEPLLDRTVEAPAETKVSNFKKLFLPVFLPQVPAYGVNAMLTPVLPSYVMEHFGLSAATAGLATACLSLAPVILDMPQNIIADRVGPHALGVFSAACLIGSGIIGAAADVSSSFAMLLLARICNGCGQSTWQMSRVLLMARAPPAERAGALAAVGGMQRFAGLISPLLGSLLASHFTILGVFAAQTCLGLIVLPLALLPVLAPTSSLLPDYIRGSGVGGAGQQTSISGMMRCAVRNRSDFATAGMACLLLGVLRQAKDFLIVLKIADLGGSMADKGFAVTMAYVFDFSLSPVSAMLMNTFGRKFSLGPALLVISLACGLLGTSASDSIRATVVIACLAGAGNGISSGLGMTLGSDIAVQREKEGRTVSKAEFLGPWREMQDLGMLLGPTVAGAVITAMSFVAATRMCLVIGFAAAAFTAVFVEEPFRPSHK